MIEYLDKNTTVETVESSALVQLLQDIRTDLSVLGDNNVEYRHNGIRVYTRYSTDTRYMNNGGDYDYFTDYRIRDGVIIRQEGWSADFDYGQWCRDHRTVYPCILSVSGLQRLAYK